MVQSNYVCSLDAARVGQDLEIRSIETGSGKTDRRLRDFGLLEGRHVRLLAKGDPLICRVGRCRLGLCKRLACGVMVAPLSCPLRKPSDHG